MQTQVLTLAEIFHNSWLTFKSHLPAMLVAIAIFLVGIYLIRSMRGLSERFIAQRSRDTLVVSFLTNIVGFVLMVILVVICLSILGWGAITNNILAGAGITTFVIGFALKDIGEHFLAGIIMAFQRPFRLGDLIEVTGIKGRVLRMTLRQTTVKTQDGRDVYIPNGIILKNPLQNLTIDNLMRSDFSVSIDLHDDAEKALQIIEEATRSFEHIEKSPAPQALVEELVEGKLKISVRFWYKTDEVKVPGAKLRSNVMVKVFKTLATNGFSVAAKPA
jgi:small conductance mechanosensitive channel